MLSLAVIAAAYLTQQQFSTTTTPVLKTNTARLQKAFAPAPSQQQFIEKITQSENQVNQKILQKRKKILNLMQQTTLSNQDINQLKKIAKQYKLKNLNFKSRSEQDFNQLLKRVDIIPSALVTAQAINESNWGRSRFATEGNNFFGMRCHRSGCGIIPKARPEGSRWEVASYSSATDSVRAYIHTLNTLGAYQKLRDLRAKMRADHQTLSPFKLAAGLTAYSIKGEKYVQLIQNIIARYLPEEPPQLG
ncbi:hypothetical protein BGC07_03345 [Piscirickettsia litoralis]|uniref:Mannosyl-glycoprotein endo-beta-N-acetylglucosamidase-like domain-containing protein n=2 Tax=Piscirickettsia litoralis TaxID=1891921 RepID=A0ABX2ZZX9_9GAMM|nr:hypothetical protein BGC07_03345 [Piscirickettsia litoralis]